MRSTAPSATPDGVVPALTGACPALRPLLRLVSRGCCQALLAGDGEDTSQTEREQDRCRTLAEETGRVRGDGTNAGPLAEDTGRMQGDRTGAKILAGVSDGKRDPRPRVSLQSSAGWPSGAGVAGWLGFRAS